MWRLSPPYSYPYFLKGEWMPFEDFPLLYSVCTRTDSSTLDTYKTSYYFFTAFIANYILEGETIIVSYLGLGGLWFRLR